MISGEITHIRPTFPDSGVPTVTIEGQSPLHRLRGDNQTRIFQNKTDRQIAEQPISSPAWRRVALWLL
jgi:uncharacterized protein